MFEAESEKISADFEFHEAASNFHEDLQESLDQLNFVSFEVFLLIAVFVPKYLHSFG